MGRAYATSGVRIEEVVKGALRGGTEVERENAAALLLDIAKVKAGTFPITLILENPNGNSGIIADKAEKSAYVPEEWRKTDKSIFYFSVDF